MKVYIVRENETLRYAGEELLKYLSSVEWVRCVRDLKLDNWVLNAINFNCLLCVRARASDEYLIV